MGELSMSLLSGFKINEVVGSTTGPDVEFIELFGPANASLAGLSLIIIEGDVENSSYGNIDRRLDFSSNDVLGDNGFFLLANELVSVTPDVEIPTNYIENSSYTMLLVETTSITGSFYNDGIVIVDGFGVTDEDNDPAFGGVPLVGPDGSFFPAGVRRVEDGVDTDTASDFVFADFEISGNTPTAGKGGTSAPAVAAKIHEVQGSGDTTPLAGQGVIVSGVVTRVFLSDNEIGGFFLQEEDTEADGDAATSEGVFIFAPDLQPGEVEVGQIVSVTGVAGEFRGQTEITLDAFTILDEGENLDLVTPTDIFSVAADARESLEGMLVSMDEVTVTETFYLTRDNQYIVSEDGKLEQYTQGIEPGSANAADFEAFSAANAERLVWIDDGSDRGDEQNPADIEIVDGDNGSLDATDTFTMGDTLTGVTGVLGVNDGGFNSGGFTVRGAEGGYIDTDKLQREAPDVGGDLKVASLNVLNLFTTIDSSGVVTETGDNPRGADTVSEFDRQIVKIAEQVVALDMDILALQELENTSDDAPLIALVAEVNAKLGSEVYTYVPTGLTGIGEAFPAVTDQQPITNGIIYKQHVVAQVGETAILDTAAFLDPNDTGAVRNRPAVTSSFEVLEGEAAGQIVTVSSNHLKSKGASGLDAGDASNLDSAQGDGQGFWNDTRAKAASELAAWLDTNPTGVEASNTLIVGDLNSYAGEDPIKALQDAGYLNTMAAQNGTDAYSYVFAGEWGTLDYVMGKGTAFESADDSFIADVWNANASFPTVFDYDQSFEPTPPGDQDLFDGSNPFRASDHDPVIVGFDFDVPRDDMAVIASRGFQPVDVLGNDPDGFEILGLNGLNFDDDRVIRIRDEAGNLEALVKLAKDGETLLVNAKRGVTDLDLSVDVANPLKNGEVVTTNLDIRVSDFTLELLHVGDQEAGANAVFDAPNLSAVMNALEAQDLGDDGRSEATIRLSSGDAFIPGLFYSASEALFGAAGVADIQIQNELGFAAIALGNHEFDNGTAALAALIDGSAGGTFDADAFKGTELFGLDFKGAEFAYLSANIDVRSDVNLAPLAEVGGQKAQWAEGAITSSVVLREQGELIGVVGATTPTLNRISSPGDVGILPEWSNTTPTNAELDALAAVIQEEVDTLLSVNPSMDKVIVLSHMQQIDIEYALAERLSNVDIIVGGGSNTRLVDETDRLRAGDSAQGQYPIFIDNADGGVTAVVNTDGSYKYVGRLVIDFDADGRIIEQSYDAEVSGSYATDDAGVAALGAEGFVDKEVQALADAVQAQILETEGNVFGVSNVFLNGNRSGTDTGDDPDGVRTQETNLGNLTADANLWYVNEYFEGTGAFDDVDFVVSIKNGGGIRASIGETFVPAGGSEPVRVVNQAILDETGAVVKPEGGISENDISNVLAFNNGLAVGLMDGAELLEAIEYGISALPGVSGRFIQISGVQFSFDETGVVDAAVVDGAGNIIAVLASDGVVNSAAEAQEFGVVTLNFLADGGDGYGFTDWFNFSDLSDQPVETFVNGTATFAQDFTEQDALAEYVLEFHGVDSGTPFAEADTGREADVRIQNLAFNNNNSFSDLVDDFLFS